MARRHFRGFDGMRAIAILLVILWHTRSSIGFPVAALGRFHDLVMFGWTGVDLFFALSGFLITSLLLDEERSARTRTFSLGAFYFRRALRILPPYYFVLAVNALVLSHWPKLFWSAHL